MTGESGKIEVRPIGGGTADDVKKRLDQVRMELDGRVVVSGPPIKSLSREERSLGRVRTG